MADAELKVLITGDASDLERTINKVNGELSKLQGSQDKVTTATKEGESAAEGAAQANKELADSVDDVTKAQEKNTNSTKKNTDEVEKNTKKHKRSVEQWEASGKAAQSLGSGINKATKPIQTASLLLAAGGVAAAKFAIDFEDSFSGVEKTVNGTVEQLAEIKQGIIDMTTVGINGHSAIPQTTTELNELAAAGGQLGIQTENILDFTEVMAQMGVATNLSGEQGASTLARLMNVMNVGQDQIRNIGSSIVDLGNNSATTEAEIADMALRMGKFGNTVGMRLPDVLGYSAALSSLGIEAQAGGSAIGRVWLSIESAVAKGGAELNAFAKHAGVSAEEFKDLWSTDTKGAFNGLLKGLKASENLTLALEELGVNNTLDIQAMQALANGFDLVESSVERANRAYTENTALQEEFDKKAETTASQLKVMKNNFVEFGRSMGETMLPMLTDASGDLVNFAKGLNSMSDTTKGALVKVGLGVVGVGAATKATASGLETVGNAMEGIATIKKVASGTGKLATFAKGLVSVGSVAKPAALGIAAVGAAVWVGKKAYDAWYDSQYNWTEGLRESTQKLQEHVDNFKDLSNIQKQVEALEFIIENPDSSKEAIADAKQKLDEIREMLEKEYDIKINSDNVGESVKKLKAGEEGEAKSALAETISEADALRPKYEKNKNKIAELEKEAESRKRVKEALAEQSLEMAVLDGQLASGQITNEEYAESCKEIAKKTKEALPESMANQDLITLELYAGALAEVEDELTKLHGESDNYIGSLQSEANQAMQLLEVNVDEGDAEDVELYLNTIAKAIKDGGLDASGYAEDAAQKLNGISWDEAFKKGGEALSNMVNDYIANAQRFGAPAEDIALKAAVLKTGFKDLKTALENGVTTEQLTADFNTIAHSIGTIPEDKQVTLSVDANGAVTILDEAGKKIADVEEETGKITVTGEYPGEENIKTALEHQEKLENRDVIYTVRYNQVGLPFTHNAKGTSDFQGGLAMINDQKGISDPTELVEINGKGYTFKGKDVILPLPKHAKVYTADETKRILSGKIPHFAKGTDPWDNAKKAWSHQQNTAIVPLTAKDSFDWIERMRNEFAGNTEAMEELDEEFVKAVKQDWKEALDAFEYGFNMGEMTAIEHLEAIKAYVSENITEGTEEYRNAMLTIRNMEKEAAENSLENSKDWLMLRAEMNDWDEFEDSFNDAFYRYTQSLKDMLDNGYITEDEYYQKSRALGDDLYEARIQNSTEWIEREKKVNGMSFASEKAAIDRIAQYTEESYRDGIISHEEYIKAKMDLTDMYYDFEKAKLEGWREDADWAKQLADVYGWDFVNKDSAEDYWKTVYKKELAAAGDMSLTAEEREKAARRADEAQMELFKARNKAVEDVLDTMEDAISNIEDALDNQLSTIQDMWANEDREEDIEETKRLLDLYEGSVTDEGRAKYKELQEELKRLEREQFVAEYEAGSKAYIDSLNDELMGFESDLEGLSVDDILNGNAISNLIEEIETSSSGLENVLSDLADELKKFNNGTYGKSTVEQNFYSTIYDSTDAEALILKAIRKAGLSNKYN